MAGRLARALVPGAAALVSCAVAAAAAPLVMAYYVTHSPELRPWDASGPCHRERGSFASTGSVFDHPYRHVRSLDGSGSVASLDWSPGPVLVEHRVREYGLPFKSHRCTLFKYIDGRSRHETFEGALVVNGRPLPAEIIWHRLLGNAVALLIVLAGAWAVAAGARRRIRRWRGLCGGCGYPVEPAVSQCPECGRAWGSQGVSGR